ncbi:SRPBCC family protein [Chitinophaga sp. RAB17]|uniref:SRPBCC family protein n=1 Tax=Chitinophaga sp. RAB17 TaxID=3233049 RepID=UPI003F91A154
MNTATKNLITVSAIVNAPVAKVWDAWTNPVHIIKWNSASDDWHTPKAENDIRTGGKFLSRMEAKDGSWGFDFAGVYDEVKDHELIAYTLGDGRTVAITFEGEGNTTKVTETFEAEAENSLEMQQSGWQAIMDHFKKYTETLTETTMV